MNNYNATLGSNMFWYCTNYLHELAVEALGYKVTSLISYFTYN